MQPTTTFTRRNNNPHFIIRVIWFLLVGWWLSGVFIAAGYLSTASIVLMPLGFWFFNRVPLVHTLRMINTEFQITTADGHERIVERPIQQFPWIIRLVYLPFGLLLGAGWLLMAWLLEMAIITLPISIWMIDRAPFVITLQRHS